jgi:hypothetical protein
MKTSILVGMHGAALFHILSMNIEAPRCCAVIEMYHKRWSQNEVHGNPPSIGNVARFLGIRHSILKSSEVEEVSTIRNRGEGTVVNVGELRKITIGAVQALLKKESRRE